MLNACPEIFTQTHTKQQQTKTLSGQILYKINMAFMES